MASQLCTGRLYVVDDIRQKETIMCTGKPRINSLLVFNQPSAEDTRCLALLTFPPRSLEKCIQNDVKNASNPAGWDIRLRRIPVKENEIPDSMRLQARAGCFNSASEGLVTRRMVRGRLNVSSSYFHLDGLCGSHFLC